MKFTNNLFASAIAVLGLMSVATGARGQAVSLGEAQNFTIVSSQGVTSSGLSVITGNVALSPLTTTSGFTFSTPAGPGIVTGAVHYNDGLAQQAQGAALTAFNTLAGLPFVPANNETGVDLGGLTLTAGVYHFNTSAALTGILTLNTGSNPNAVFVFQIGSTLTAAVASSIVVTGAGGGIDPNVFWEVGSSATLNTGAAFYGNILALASVSLGTGSSLVDGRVIALNGAVTLLGNSLSAPVLGSAATGRYWNGSSNNVWSSTNWSSTAAGADQVALGSSADVVFSINDAPSSPLPQNQNTILDSNTTISSLAVNDPVAVTIGGLNTLTISSTGLTTGINVSGGSGLTTIGCNLVLGYLSQIVTVNNQAGLLISGVIGGSNGLTKSGTGILTLTGADSYTGATVVTGGTLQLGNGLTPGSSIASSNSVVVTNVAGRSSVLAIDLNSGESFGNSVTDNGLITTIGSGTNTLSGVLSGTGRLAQNGTGVAILTGSNSYSAGTAINQGTVAVGSVTAMGSGSTSATYLGIGSVAVTNATLESTGALNAANGPAWINIGTVANPASYTQTNGTLVLGLADNNYHDNDFLNVTGTANISDPPKIVINSYNGFKAALHDEILLGNAADGGFKGRFKTPFVDHANGLEGTVMAPHIDYGNVAGNEDPDGMTLVYRQAIAFNNIGIGLTTNQLAVANALNNIQTIGNLPVNGGPLLPAFNVLNQTQLNGLPQDYDLIAPEGYAAMPEVALSAIDIHTTNLEHRMWEIRNGATGFSDSGLSLNDGKATNNFEMSRNGKDLVSTTAPEPENDKLGFWVAGAGDFVNIAGDGNGSGYDLTTAGLTTGLDYRMSKSFSVGLMSGYENTQVSLINNGNIDVNGGKGGLYAVYHENGWYANALANAGGDSYTTTRAALGGDARGSTSGAELEGYLGGGYDVTRNSWVFGPTAKAEYSYVDINGFTETGSLAPLSIHSQSDSSFVTRLGGHVSYKMEIGHMLLTPDLALEWDHQYLNSTYGVVSNFSNNLGGPFTVTGPQIGPDSLGVSLGANLQISPRVGTFLYYTGQYGARMIANSVSGGISFSF